MMSTEVFGMTGCTTVKNAQNWLEANGVAHDYARYDKLLNLADKLQELIAASDLTTVLNLKSQAFRKLDEAAQQELVADPAKAIAAMVKNPRLIKRPIAFSNGQVLAGFVEAQWHDALMGAP